VIVKQEAGWFQLWAEKRQRKTAEKLAVQQEKKRLAKEAEDARNQFALLKQLFKKQYEGHSSLACWECPSSRAASIRRYPCSNYSRSSFTCICSSARSLSITATIPYS
jgi:hypothetical protein